MAYWVDQFQTVSSVCCSRWRLTLISYLLVTLWRLQLCHLLYVCISVWVTLIVQVFPYDRCVTDMLFECIERKSIIERNPKNWGVLGPHPLGWGCSWPLRNKPPVHICYHVKFGSFASKGVCINRKEIPKLFCAWALPLAAGA